MNRLKKYKNNIIFVILIILSISLILNCIADIDDGNDLLQFESSISKIVLFICMNIATVHYILKIISRLRVNRKKLFKTFLYVPENIVQILRRNIKNYILVII